MKLKYKLLIVFFTALVLELNSIAGFHYLMEKNWIGMFMMAFVNPMISLPMNHFSIECKSFKERLYIAIAFALGFGIGVITIRPFII
jgi:hypothetical protein